ncbi:hypothetical protein, partial [Ureibacillus endophyticus]
MFRNGQLLFLLADSSKRRDKFGSILIVGVCLQFMKNKMHNITYFSILELTRNKQKKVSCAL